MSRRYAEGWLQDGYWLSPIDNLVAALRRVLTKFLDSPIGWGGKPSGHGFGLTFDLGVLYQGSPKLSVQAHPTNPAIVPASFYTNLEAERAKTENDIKNYKYWPVVGVGFSFSF